VAGSSGRQRGRRYNVPGSVFDNEFPLYVRPASDDPLCKRSGCFRQG
jgi:hypothetical protein